MFSFEAMGGGISSSAMIFRFLWEEENNGECLERRRLSFFLQDVYVFIPKILTSSNTIT